LPIERLYESATVLAFYHPRPVYPVHVLIVPKQPIKSLLDLTDGQTELMKEVLLAAQAVIRQLNLEESGYRLIVNGGAYQEVELLHFHLISEESIKK
jgi:histidine triad (HIT) family protein